MKTLSKINLCSQIPFENQSQKSPKSASSGSVKVECRYCLCEESKEKLIQPCNCEGSLKYVHNSCLGEWIKNSQKPYEIIYENDTAYYTSLCEICKYNMKYQINFENNFFVSFIYTMKNTLFSIKSCFFLLLHSLVIFYFFNRLTFLVYHGIYVVSKNFKTKYLMRFVNEMAIFSTILWYTNDIVRYYGNLYFEQRKSLLVFLPKEKQEKSQLPHKNSDFSFEMTLEKINPTLTSANSFNVLNVNNNNSNPNFISSNNENAHLNFEYFSSFKNANNKTNEVNAKGTSYAGGSEIKIGAEVKENCNTEGARNLIKTGSQSNLIAIADDQIRHSNANVNAFSSGTVNNLNEASTENKISNGYFYEIEFN